MPLNISGATIEGGSSAFTIKNTSGTTVFKQGVAPYGANTFGYMENSNVPGFIAGGTGNGGWVNYATNNWGKYNNYCTSMAYNRGSHYNTSTTRFTAPVAGPYFFVWTAYTKIDNYAHPMFAVNGDITLRRTYTPYKIRSHGLAPNYEQDHQIQETIYLYAGDYVETYCYAAGTGYHIPNYCLFSGVYVG